MFPSPGAGSVCERNLENLDWGYEVVRPYAERESQAGRARNERVAALVAHACERSQSVCDVPFIADDIG